jgi:hypothetical protein
MVVRRRVVLIASDMPTEGVGFDERKRADVVFVCVPLPRRRRN